MNKLIFEGSDPMRSVYGRSFDLERRHGRCQFSCSDCGWRVDDYGREEADAPGRMADHVADTGHRVSGQIETTVFIQKRTK